MSNVVSPEFVAEAQEIVDALNRDLIAVEDENRKGVDEGEYAKLRSTGMGHHQIMRALSERNEGKDG